ncbi:MAG: hypothetical protein AB7N80_12890 [Bdellovibrionales bacterium]
MNSLLKSVGKIFLLVQIGVAAGCKSSPGPDEPAPSVQVREQLETEISLKADRESLAELRKEVPEQKRQANDELALVLQLMGEVKLNPSEVQSRYQRAMQKRRAEFRDKVRQLRETYRREEAKRKAHFLDQQKQSREDFKSQSAKREQVREFYSGQDRERQHFFAGERDRRKDFESEIDTQSKDFDSYMREKQKEFLEQHRLYSKRFREAPTTLAPQGTGQ